MAMNSPLLTPTNLRNKYINNVRLQVIDLRRYLDDVQLKWFH